MADTQKSGGSPANREDAANPLPRFTPEQLRAIDARDPLVCVAAGAGSGKTTILVERIVKLLEEFRTQPGRELGLDQIVAITFTDKAAAEMKARLRRKFREAANLANSADMHFWREMERQVDSARVSTIHAFCASILREQALRVGLDPDWGVLSDAESEQLAEKAVEETLYRLLEREDPACFRLSLEMSRNQLKDALAFMLANRWKFQTFPDDERYASPKALYDRWTEESPGAQEALLRVFQYNQEARSLLVALDAFEGQCTDASDKREGQRCACRAVLQAMLQGQEGLTETLNAYLAAYPRMGGSKDHWPSPDRYNALKDALKEAKDFFQKKCLLPERDEAFEQKSAQMTCDFIQVGNQVMGAYRQLRQGRSVLDFEDIINETLDLLRGEPAVRDRVARGIRYLLIDEFQDTDNRQLDIAELLAMTEEGLHLFIVGDVKQSVYYFRGAEVDIFNRIRDKTREPLTLPDNFRSLPGVLHFVNDFFHRTRLLDAVEAYRPMGIHRQSDRAPCVEYFLPQSAGKETAPAMRERDVTFIARRILELCGGSAPLRLTDEKSGLTRDATYDDVVLLFRRGSYMHEYESALREFHIPYNRISGAGFFQRREIQDILALLQVLLDPWDEEALVIVLRSPLIGLSDESLMRMALMEGGIAAAFHSGACPASFEQDEVLDGARRLFMELYERRESEPGHLLRQVFARTGYEAVLLGRHLGLQHAANLRKVIQMADDFSQSRPSTLAEFTRYLEDITFRELKEGESTLQSRGMGAVTLMSIHKAKGLEFPIVFLPECFANDKAGGQQVLLHHKHFGVAAKTTDEDGTMKAGNFFEVINRFRRHDEKMESARILYVAMTRAREYLVLCGHPFPPGFSWADTFNRAYDLADGSDEGIIAAPGWQLRVTRNLPKTCPVRPAQKVAGKLDKDAIETRIQPVVMEDVGDRRVFSVTRLLSQITGLMDMDEEWKDTPGIDITPELLRHRRYSMERGTLVHRLFEYWDFAGDRLPEVKRLVREAGLGMDRAPELSVALLEVAQRFRASVLWPMFFRASRVERETPFLLDIGTALIRGVVDAVIDDDVIVDYKTGQPDPSLQHYYEMQLYLYAAAFKTLKGRHPSRGILWYADHGSMHTVTFDDTDIRKVLEMAALSCGSA